MGTISTWGNVIRRTQVIFMNEYTKIIINKEIEKLKHNAIKELKKLGYSYDNIAKIIHVGKITAIKEMKK